jgi:hypothetical protein
MPSRSLSSSLRIALALGLALAVPACSRAQAGTSLQIQVPEADRDADLYVDGHYVGQVSAVGKEPVGPVMLAPGVHRVEVRKAGRFPVQRTVRVDAQTPAQTVIDAELLEDPQ